MRVEANSIKMLIQQSDNTLLFQELYHYLNQKLAAKGQLFTSNKMSMIGYHFVDYKTSTYDGKWPLIALAPQKKTINLYIMVFKDNQGIAELYKDVFGKSNVGKSCIRIRKMNEQKYQAIDEMIGYIKKEIISKSK